MKQSGTDWGWSKAIQHAKKWRGETKRLFGTSFNQVEVLQDFNGQPTIFALGSSNSPDKEITQPQTLLSIPIAPDGHGPAPENVAFSSLLSQSAENLEKERPSAELLLLYERMRTTLVTGIVSYSVQPKANSIVLATPTQLMVYDAQVRDGSTSRTTKQSKEGIFRRERSSQSVSGSKAQYSTRPHHQWIRESLLSVVETSSSLPASAASSILRGDEKLFESDLLPNITNGTASYIVQEELERYEGFFWSPARLELLYERVDESQVQELSFSSPGHAPEKPMRYPVAGTNNPTSTLRMCSIDSTDGSITDSELKVDLRELVPWMEYLSRMGWTPDGENVYLVAMDRLQTKLAVLLIHRSAFTEHVPVNAVRNLYEETCPQYWINANNLLQFLPTKVSRSLQMIIGSEKSNLSHLYLHTYTSTSAGFDHHETRITGNYDGDRWEVVKEAKIVIDTRREHVYYLANKISPLIISLCVSSYGRPAQINGRECAFLTPSDLCYRRIPSLMLNPEVGFVCWLSSTTQPPKCLFYRLVHDDATGGFPQAIPTYNIDIGIPTSMTAAPMNTTEGGGEVPINDVCKTRIFAYESQNSGKTHYAMLVWPNGEDTISKPFPIIQLVYAGPSVQLVRDSWYSYANLMKFVTLGYALLIVDGRGSSNRGVEFEGWIKERMGTVEVEDQVEGLRVVTGQVDFLDTSRVGVTGWSYGGYMALLMLAHHPDIYKAACAGGAVCAWDLYDTAYTERYMGLPQQNAKAYKESSLDGVFEKLPNEDGRLLVVHGLIDENVHFTNTEKLINALVEAGKPHQLLIFPKERHGIRGKAAIDYRDARVFTFFNRALKTTK